MRAVSLGQGYAGMADWGKMRLIEIKSWTYGTASLIIRNVNETHPEQRRDTMRAHLSKRSRNTNTGPIRSAQRQPIPAPMPARSGTAAAATPQRTTTYANTGPKSPMDRAQQLGCVLQRYRQASCRPAMAPQPSRRFSRRWRSDRHRGISRAGSGQRGQARLHLYPQAGKRSGDAAAVREANACGFTVNLSANNPTHADELAALSIGPVVTVLPAAVHGNVKVETPEGRRVVVCPATYREDITCASCGLCQVRDRKVIVGFPAHGAAGTAANNIAEGKQWQRSNPMGVR